MAARKAAALLAAIAAGTLSAVGGVDQSPFPDPIAHPFEARIGGMYQAGDERLRLDIGHSFALFEPQIDSAMPMSIGVDFMTWTRLRSETNFKFPVETIDYWFGVHAKIRLGDSPWEARLRLAHISSHLVDGLADAGGTITPTPFVYSREFAEVLIGAELGVIRPYAGVTAVWATQPKDPDPFIPQAGIDLRLPLGDQWQLRGGYDLRLIGINGMLEAASAAQLGVMLRNANGTGILVSAYGYAGKSMHGMFYREYDAYGAIGFQFLW